MKYPLIDASHFGTSLRDKGVVAVYFSSGHNQGIAIVYQNGAQMQTIDIPDTSALNVNDRIGFRVNMQNKTAQLFYNGIDLGTTFTNIPNAIVPAASGTGWSGWTSIKVCATIYD